VVADLTTTDGAHVQAAILRRPGDALPIGRDRHLMNRAHREQPIEQIGERAERGEEKGGGRGLYAWRGESSRSWRAPARVAVNASSQTL